MKINSQKRVFCNFPTVFLLLSKYLIFSVPINSFWDDAPWYLFPLLWPISARTFGIKYYRTVHVERHRDYGFSLKNVCQGGTEIALRINRALYLQCVILTFCNRLHICTCIIPYTRIDKTRHKADTIFNKSLHTFFCSLFCASHQPFILS